MVGLSSGDPQLTGPTCPVSEYATQNVSATHARSNSEIDSGGIPPPVEDVPSTPVVVPSPVVVWGPDITPESDPSSSLDSLVAAELPVVPTVGSTGDGVPELWEAVLAHRAHAEQSGDLRERREFRLGEELREIVAQRLGRRARQICSGERWDELTAEVVERVTDPWTAADEMLAAVDA